MMRRLGLLAIIFLLSGAAGRAAETLRIVPISADGWTELIHWVREQAVSITRRRPTMSPASSFWNL